MTDRAGAVAMGMKEQGNLVQVERVLVDATYTGKPFAEAIQATIGAAVEVVKPSELQACTLTPKGDHTVGSDGKIWFTERKSNTIGCPG